MTIILFTLFIYIYNFCDLILISHGIIITYYLLLNKIPFTQTDSLQIVCHLLALNS